MEAHAQSVENHLIEGLDFSLGAGANYVTDRRSVSFFPQGGDYYSPTGVKVIKIGLNGDSWLDPSTVKLLFEIHNLDGTSALNPVGQPHVFFRRLRVMCGGVLLEDIDHYNRTHELFETCTASHHRSNLGIEGFGIGANENIPANSHRVVAMSLLSGILNQPKYLPIRYCPITIELELVSTPAIAVQSDASTNFVIRNVQLKADVITLDNAIDNDYASHLLQGKSLPINFSTYTTLSQVANASEVNLNISRALTRIKALFLTMVRTGDLTVSRTEANYFFHAMDGSYNPDNEVSIEVQLGSKRYPEYPIQSSAEAFYQLRKTLGMHSSAFHSLDITPVEYRREKFIVGIDFEKVLDRSFTGYSSKSGDLLTVKMKNTGMANNDSGLVYTTLWFDSIMSINDTGVQVYD